MNATLEPFLGSAPANLMAFLNQPCDSCEYRRVMAVKLALQQVPYAQICAFLDVAPGFVSQKKQAYLTADD